MCEVYGLTTGCLVSSCTAAILGCRHFLRRVLIRPVNTLFNTRMSLLRMVEALSNMV